MSFPAYDEYKASGVEWLGELPTHWEVRSIKAIAQLFGRIGFRGYTTNDIVDEGRGAITLSPSNMTESGMQFDNCTYISWEKYRESPEIMIQPHDILMVKTGSTLGKLAYVPECNREMTVNPQIVVFKKVTCQPQFLFYFLSTPYIQGRVEVKNAGSSIPTITQQSISNFQLALPPKDEQTTIAAFLDRETGKIDELVAEQRRLIELLKEKRQAVISHAVTKGMNPNAPLKSSGIEWLGDVPEHWEVIALKYLASLKSGDGITAESIEESGDYPVFGGNGLRGFTNAFTHEGYYVIIGRQGALCGNVNYGEGKFWASEHAVVATPTRIIDTVWLGEMIRSMNLNQYSETAAQPGLSMVAVGNLRTAFPPIKEQQEISKFVTKMTTEFDSLGAEAIRAIELLQERRTALISAAVTGKIDVRELTRKEAKP